MENVNQAAEVVVTQSRSFFGSIKDLAVAVGTPVVNVVKEHPIAATVVVVGGTSIVLGRKKIAKYWNEAKVEVEKDLAKKHADVAAAGIAANKAKAEQAAAKKAADDAAEAATKAAAAKAASEAAEEAARKAAVAAASAEATEEAKAAATKASKDADAAAAAAA